MIVLLALACVPDSTLLLHFDGPIAGVFLPIEAGPFDTEVGLIASSRSGVITPIDLKEGRLLADSATGSFLRAAAIPTGRARLLLDLAIVGEGGTVTLWTADSASDQLLSVPWVLGVDADGVPVVQEPHATTAQFFDEDSSGDSPTITPIVVRAGWSTTEDWSIEYDGTRWWAKGSRSGQQQAAPVSGEEYHSESGEVEFRIDGEVTLGDRFEFRTDTGIREFTLGGRIAGLASRDGRVFVSVADEAAPAVHVYDGVTGVWLGRAPLAAGSEPGRICLGPDGVLYVADTARPVVHELTLTFATTLTAAEDQEILTDAPVVDVAWKAGDGQDGTPYEHLFVAPLAGRRVDVYDTVTDRWLDPNPLTIEAWGPLMSGPVSGLAASLGDVWLQQQTAWGARQRVGTIAVTSADGFLYQVDAETGCLVEDARGAHGPNYDYDGTEWASLQDLGAPSDVHLQIDPVSSEQITASPCGGVTRSDVWTVTYQSATLDWRVEGRTAGEQQARAGMDQRYLSDDGAISFVLVAGALPPTDGDFFTFSVKNGLLQLEGSYVDGGQTPKFWESPGRPVAYETRNGPTGGGWDPVDIRQYVLVPAQGSDIVGEVWLEAGQTDFLWE